MKSGGPSLEANLDAFTRTNMRALALLVVLSLALFLPGFFTLQPMDRDEPRFAQATKQMLETGDYVAIRFQDEARNKKPVGIYWMQAGAVAVAEAVGVPDARDRIWVYRLPSLMGALAAVLLTYWAALAFASRRAALLAGLLLASTLLLGVEARLAKTDAVVAATVVAAMGAMARLYLSTRQGPAWRAPAIFWGAIGLGLLVKGPITPMVPLLAFVALAVKDRAAGWALDLKPLRGLALALLIVLPWFVLIMIQTEGAFLRDSVGADMLGKVQGGKESHGAPPLTYLAAFWATAWPMAPFAALAAPFAWSQRRNREVAFLLAWLIPTWLVFEATPTKLPHYVLPLYPAIAILIAVAIERGAMAAGQGWRRAVLFWLPGFALLVAAVGVGGSYWLRALPGLSFLAGLPLLVWIAFKLSRRIGRSSTLELALAAPFAAFVLYASVYGGLLTGPSSQPFALSPRLADALGRAEAATTACPALAPATTLYREPSLVFLTTTDLFMTDAEGAAAFLRDATCRAAYVDSRTEAQFLLALKDEPGVQLVERVQGIATNGGRKLDIGLWVRGDGP
ncbi:MAG: glycosyl transferase [Hyphomicrobiales bacterium]|nr:glycosyl transferase [Hyphomicrobiales bacterium]